MNNHRTRAFVLAFCLMIVSAGVSAAAGGPTISNVKVAENLRSVTIFGSPELGRHHVFAIKDPHRLVIDFESTDLGRVPRKIRINRDGINEIRLGVSASKARIVVDFGDSQIPPYRITRRDRNLVLFFSEPPKTDPDSTVRAIRATTRKKPVPQAKRAGKALSKSKKKSSLAIRSAGVTGDMVFLELSDRKNPKRRYRFVMEVDTKNLQPGQLSVSDGTGRVQCFRVMPARPNLESDVRTAKDNDPVKTAPASTQDYAADEGKFPWGKQGVTKQQVGGSHTEEAKPAPAVSVKIRQRGPST